jgi:hypothetical protein
MSAAVPFTEALPRHESQLLSTPIRELGVKIEGSPLEPVIAEFLRELEAVGIRKLKPHFYLTTDWVVCDDTIAIGIPFYLARPDLTALQAEQEGHLEGVGRKELLRYLRHEMGHVVNYSYQLYNREDWVKHFGSMTQPYIDEYRPEPFSRRFVVHLPGWYAQKHPDEDWAETFAVWMTPGLDWRKVYAGWPEALAKLEYCDRLMKDLRDREPIVTTVDLDWDVSNLSDSLAEHYQSLARQRGGIARAGRGAADHLREQRRAGERLAGPEAAGGRPDPQVGARHHGRRLPLDGPLPGADSSLAAPPGPARPRAAPGLPGRPRAAGPAGPGDTGDRPGDEPRPPRLVPALIHGFGECVRSV